MANLYEDRSWTSGDGLSLYYRDYAGPADYAGPPVLCLHGLTRNSRDFADLASHIAATRRVIVPDMRGRGQSDYAPDSATYNPAQYVADVELLLAEQGIERFIAIGTSMGGLMTMLLAATKPGRIAALVMNDIGPEVNLPGVARIAGYVGHGRSYPTWIHAARSIAEVHGPAFPDYDLDTWLEMAKRTLVVTQNGRISFDYDMAIAEPFKEPGNAAPPNLWLAYEALRGVPMVLVRGELSDLLTLDTVKQMAVRNPAMTSVTVPRVGHAPKATAAPSTAPMKASPWRWRWKARRFRRAPASRFRAGSAISRTRAQALSPSARGSRKTLRSLPGWALALKAARSAHAAASKLHGKPLDLTAMMMMAIKHMMPGPSAPAFRFVLLGSTLALAGAALPLAPAAAQQAQPVQQAQPTVQPPPSIRPTPSQLELSKLLWSTVAAVDHANQSGNYSVLRDISAQGFQINFNPARLTEVFAGIRNLNIDLSNALLVPPTYYEAPQLVSNDVFRVRGVFQMRPISIGFDMYFQWEQGRWKLFGIDLQPQAMADGQ